MSIETAITVNVISTFIVLFAYSYLYLQYRYTYLVKWVSAWVLYAARQIFMDKFFIGQNLSPGLDIFYAFLSFSFSFLMIAGTAEFAGLKLSRLWPMAAVCCFIATAIGRLFLFPFEIYAFPGIVFIGTSYIATGLIIKKIKVSGVGRIISWSAFILLGLHFYDMLFLFNIDWIVPWGFLFDGLLKLAVAIGILLIYFERTKNELEKYYLLLEENTIDVIYRFKIAKPSGFEYISPAILQLTGYDVRYFKNIKQVISIIHPGDRNKVKQIMKHCSEQKIFSPIRIINKNGEIVWVEQKYSLVYEDELNAIAAEGIVRDVTSRVLLEQDVSRLDRLNIAGQMATSLAHEIRNPLSTVRGYIQLMGSRNEFENYRDRLTMMLDEIDRTNGIITEYLLLSKNKRVDMKAANLNNIIKSIHPLIEVDAAASNIEVVLSLGDIPDLPLDDNEIKQMLLNFVRNGIEAMPGGGLLVIRTATSGDETVLSISDRGKGIPQHVMDNMGKPFLTTKDNGTGLGMAVCYRIAGRHNAKIEFDTGNKGTTVFVKFKIN